jgi:hypothetical protein
MPAIARLDGHISGLAPYKDLEKDVIALGIDEPVFRDTAAMIALAQDFDVLLHGPATQYLKPPVGPPPYFHELSVPILAADQASSTRFETSPSYKSSVRFL